MFLEFISLFTACESVNLRPCFRFFTWVLWFSITLRSILPSRVTLFLLFIGCLLWRVTRQRFDPQSSVCLTSWLLSWPWYGLRSFNTKQGTKKSVKWLVCSVLCYIVLRRDDRCTTGDPLRPGCGRPARGPGISVSLLSAHKTNNVSSLLIQMWQSNSGRTVRTENRDSPDNHYKDKRG